MGFKERLFRASIWHPDSIPLLELKYAGMKRVMWPLVDGLYVYIGVVAGLFGAPSINAVFGVETSQVFCFSFAVVSFAAFVGVAFMRLWLLETIAKIVLVGGHIALLFSLGSAAFGLDSLARLYLTGFVGVSLAWIVYRLYILRRERVEREAEEPEDDAE